MQCRRSINSLHLTISSMFYGTSLLQLPFYKKIREKHKFSSNKYDFLITYFHEYLMCSDYKQTRERVTYSMTRQNVECSVVSTSFSSGIYDNVNAVYLMSILS